MKLIRETAFIRTGFMIGTIAWSVPCALATTKGLSQIVTPDIQKPGELSLSYQEQAVDIGNPHQFQGELGITSWAELAVFKGLSPREMIFGAEFGLIQKEPWLLSTGFVNLSTLGGSPQPFLETGYYTAQLKGTVGVIYAASRPQALLGLAYDHDSHWRAQVDFESGEGNFSTLGFTYTLNEHLQFNPALYFSNRKFTDIEGYFVMTYTLPVWKHAAPMKEGSGSPL